MRERCSRTTCVRTSSRPGIEPQGAAKSFQRGDGVVLQQVALSHSRRRGEVIRIDFQRLMAIANCRFVLTQVIVGDAALAPGLGDPGRLVDQFGGQPGGFRVPALVVELEDRHGAFRGAAGRTRHHSSRMPLSAIVRTPRSRSTSARPSTAFDE